MSIKIKNNYQWKPPNNGIKHLKSEECEHLEISSRPKIQYRTALPLNNHKAHYTSTWNKNGAKRTGRASPLGNVNHSHACV